MKTTAELAADQAAFWNGKGGQMWIASYDRIQKSIAHYGVPEGRLVGREFRRGFHALLPAPCACAISRGM